SAAVPTVRVGTAAGGTSRSSRTAAGPSPIRPPGSVPASHATPASRSAGSSFTSASRSSATLPSRLAVDASSLEAAASSASCIGRTRARVPASRITAERLGRKIVIQRKLSHPDPLHNPTAPARRPPGERGDAMKTALIVDDSRLARTVLSRLLAEHDVAADTAPTAEAALEYLKERRPDVVFLDHNMPGMDGFEALEAIKANPATATIPVMMYTSQEGELYVGQARALGALGVLPKSLHPVEVTKVLRSLHLIPGEELRANGSRPASDTQRLRELIEELFYEQAAVLREEIRSELRRAAAAQARAAAVPAATPAPPPPAAKTEAGRRWQLAAAIATAAAVALGALHLQSTSRLAEADRRAERLAADAAALASAVALAPAAA